MNFTLGSTATNQFYVTAPGVIYTGLSGSETEGVLRRNSSLRLTGGTQTNASDAPGEDCELVISYLL